MKTFNLLSVRLVGLQNIESTYGAKSSVPQFYVEWTPEKLVPPAKKEGIL